MLEKSASPLFKIKTSLVLPKNAHSQVEFLLHRTTIGVEWAATGVRQAFSPVGVVIRHAGALRG
jgi:hypothetical protein